jgi:hypothetical protein
MPDDHLEGIRIEELPAQPTLAVRVRQPIAQLDLPHASITDLPSVAARPTLVWPLRSEDR